MSVRAECTSRAETLEMTTGSESLMRQLDFESVPRPAAPGGASGPTASRMAAVASSGLVHPAPQGAQDPERLYEELDPQAAARPAPPTRSELGDATYAKALDLMQKLKMLQLQHPASTHPARRNGAGGQRHGFGENRRKQGQPEAPRGAYWHP